VYGATGTIVSAPGSKAIGVANVGQLDFVWNLTPFLQLHGVYSHGFAEDFIEAAKGRDFDHYRLQIRGRF
jgi:hypothetical protein